MDALERSPRTGSREVADALQAPLEPGLALVEQVTALIERGELFLAQDLAQRGMEREPDSLRLLHLRALALAELGATSAARILIGATDARGPPGTASGIAGVAASASEDAGALIGRLYKDAWLSSNERIDLVQARDAYLGAFEASAGTYAGINAASMSWLLGDTERAAALAERVTELAQCDRRSADALSPADDYWRLATIGEAALLLDRAEVAGECYAAAVARAGNRFRLLSVSRRQLEMLRRHGVVVPDGILALLAPPRIVVFTDRSSDSGWAEDAPFPPDTERTAAQAIRHAVDETDARIGYSSAACGGDILFLEAMQARGAETHVVLPFDADDFLRASVRFGGASWEERFNEVIARASSVALATKERFLGDELLFQFANRMLLGVSRLRARQLSTEPILIVLIESSSSAPRRGGMSMQDLWSESGGVTILDLAAMRGPTSPPARVHARPRYAVGRRWRVVDARRPSRVLRTLLFADMKNFTRLTDEHVLGFEDFLRSVARTLQASGLNPEYLRTVGDGILAVTAEPDDMARYALALARAVECANEEVSLPIRLEIRIALHAAPVYRLVDPLTGQPTYYGSHVNRAARLEPVTIPGEIYATEEFVALLEGHPRSSRSAERNWRTTYVGELRLAKNFDRQRVYRLSESLPV